MDDKEFLEYVMKGIVNHPESVQVDRRVDDLGVLLTLKVHPEDMGQVIGKNGATARAVRTLLRIVGMKNDARVNLKIEEPEGSTRAPRFQQEASEGTSEEVSAPTVAMEEPQAQPEAERKEINVDEALGNLE
ncbi:MAG: KH domain-containing protein [Candidatus Spechtbacterales bacterium]